MVSLGGLESEIPPKAHYQPLSAEEYVGYYYPCIHDPRQKGERDPLVEEIRNDFRGLADIPLIECATLAATWKYVFPDEGLSQIRSPIPSLRSLAANRAVDYAVKNPLQSREDLEIWRTVGGMPDITLHVLERLKEVEIPHPLLSVLNQHFLDATFVDLSPYRLTLNDTTELLKQLRQCQVLVLKQMPQVSDAFVACLLAMSSLRILIVFGKLSKSLLPKLQGKITVLCKEDYDSPTARNVLTEDGYNPSDDEFDIFASPQPTSEAEPDFIMFGVHSEPYFTQGSGVGIGTVESINSVDRILQAVRDALQMPEAPLFLETAARGSSRVLGTLFCEGELWRARLPANTWSGRAIQYGFVYKYWRQRGDSDISGSYRYAFTQQHPSQPGVQLLSLDAFLELLQQEKPNLTPSEGGWLAEIKEILQDGTKFTLFSLTEWSLFVQEYQDWEPFKSWRRLNVIASTSQAQKRRSDEPLAPATKRRANGFDVIESSTTSAGRNLRHSSKRRVNYAPFFK